MLVKIPPESELAAKSVRAKSEFPKTLTRLASMMSPRVALPFLLVCAFVSTGTVYADKATTLAARKIYQAHQDSLVVITAISTISFTTDGESLPDQERRTQTLGTIIDAKGLIMLSNSALDPSIGMEGNRGRPVGSETEFVTVTKASARFPEIQVNLADGTEYHAALIDKDEKIDLAFLRIDQKQLKARKTALPYVNINNRITEGEISIADQVIGLSRSSPVYAYIPSVIPGYVTAVSKRDYTFYISTAGTAQGIPLFALNGKFIGITVQRIVEGKRTNLLGTLGAGTVKTMADLAATRRSR